MTSVGLDPGERISLKHHRFGSNIKITRALCSLALGLGGLGSAWSFALHKSSDQNIAIGVQLVLSTTALVLVGVRMLWSRGPAGSFFPQKSLQPIPLAGLAPGTMALMLLGTNVTRLDHEQSDLGQFIFCIGFALQVFLLVTMVGVVFRKHHRERGSGFARLIERHAIPPLFLVAPVGLGISFNAAEVFGGNYVMLAWVVSLFGTFVTIVGVVPATFYLFNVQDDSLPLIPVLIAPPSLSLASLLTVELLESSHQPTSMLTDALQYILIVIALYAMVVSCCFLKRIWKSIFSIPNSLSFFYASTTFPLATASIAFMKFGDKTNDDHFRQFGKVVMCVATVVTFGVMLALPFHLWREQTSQPAPSPREKLSINTDNDTDTHDAHQNEAGTHKADSNATDTSKAGDDIGMNNAGINDTGTNEEADTKETDGVQPLLNLNQSTSV
eukprot:m.103809 g.103809  ORF g.103809 m.103809 type:complete len:442 (+) comp27518_c2_seq3:211-1536(+)